MLWIMRGSGFFFAAVVLIVLSPSIQSFPPAEAIRSSHFDGYLRFPDQDQDSIGSSRFSFRQAPSFHNADECGVPQVPKTDGGLTGLFFSPSPSPSFLQTMMAELQQPMVETAGEPFWSCVNNQRGKVLKETACGDATFVNLDLR